VRSNLWLKVLYPDCIATFRGLVFNPSRNLQTKHFCKIFYPPIVRLKNSWYIIANESLDSDMCGRHFQTRQFCRIFHSPIVRLKNSWSVIANISFVSDQWGRMSPNPLLQTNCLSSNREIGGSRTLLLTFYWYRPWDWYVSRMILLPSHTFPNLRWMFCPDYC
jgi:hypothetical protein